VIGVIYFFLSELVIAYYWNQREMYFNKFDEFAVPGYKNMQFTLSEQTPK
jgi:hypothetical protein